MNGKIYFSTMDDLIEFLSKFSGKSTAVFEVRDVSGQFVLEFTGGY